MDVRGLAVRGLSGALTTIRERGVPGESSVSVVLEAAFEDLDAPEMARLEALDIALVAVGRFIGVDYSKDEPSNWALVAAERLFAWERQGRDRGEVVAVFADAAAQLLVR